MNKKETEEAPRSFFMKVIKLVLNNTQRVSPAIAGYLGYVILGRPPKKEIKPGEQLFLNEATHGRLPGDQSRIRTYRWLGTKAKILMAHGWDSHSGRWMQLGRELVAKGYDIAALDAPGHGASKGGTFTVVEYAKAIKTHAEIYQPDIIIGHSAGGMAIAFELTKNLVLNQGLKGLILLGTPGYLSDFMDSFRNVLQLTPPVMKSVDDAFVKRSGYSYHHFDITEFAASFTMPGLVIHDKHDEIAPFKGAEEISKNWPKSQLIATENLGHSLQSEAVFQHISSFILRLTPPILQENRS